MALRFEVEVEGRKSNFAECDVPKTTVTPIQYREATGTLDTLARPGTQANEPFTLTRNLVSKDAFWDWRKAIMDGVNTGSAASYKKSGSVTQYDHDGSSVIARWHFKDAFISERKIDPDLDGGGNEILKERITMVADVIEKAE
jgi:phage tail-like protein